MAVCYLSQIPELSGRLISIQEIDKFAKEEGL
jgi:hypothetical protein